MLQEAVVWLLDSICTDFEWPIILIMIIAR